MEVRIDANDLVFKAKADIEKVVRKCTPTSGAIYLHKSFIGKRFRIILIPLDEEPQIEKEVAKAEEDFKKNIDEIKDI